MVDAFGVVDDVLLQAVQGIIDLDHRARSHQPRLRRCPVRDAGCRSGPDRPGSGPRGAPCGGCGPTGHRQPAARGKHRGRPRDPVQRLGPVRPAAARGSAAADAIREHADPEANVIFGASFSDSLGEDVLITLIATGLTAQAPARAQVGPPEPFVPEGPPTVDPAAATEADVADGPGNSGRRGRRGRRSSSSPSVRVWRSPAVRPRRNRPGRCATERAR